MAQSRTNQTIIALVKMATYTVSTVTLTSTTTLAQGQGFESSCCCWHREGNKGQITRENYTLAVIIISLKTFTTVTTISIVILTNIKNNIKAKGLSSAVALCQEGEDSKPRTNYSKNCSSARNKIINNNNTHISNYNKRCVDTTRSGF
jgi:hypothetical protein